VATQNPELRKRFSGKPEFVVTFFEFIAQEVREYLAQLGFRSLDEAIGHVESLDVEQAVSHWKASGLDLSRVLAMPPVGDNVPRRCVTQQDHGLVKALDHTLIEQAADALERREPVRITLPVRNVNRTVGAMLGHELTKRWGSDGLPADTIDVTLTGSAGQSFGAFVPQGITLRLYGDANDYLAKGLSGGRIVVRPDRAAGFAAEHNIIAGNVVAYGATSGQVFIRGQVGERFCVRNSGATAVVEGVGDHGGEYMTGGRVVVLGRTGRNFAAGMSGGVAFVLDLRTVRVNRELVDLEPLDDADAAELLELVTRHRAETESAVAWRLLQDWDAARARFTKVTPRAYARVMAVRQAAETEGLDLESDEVWVRIMEASNG
jgi:glutamate synthase (NADPH/NADH) large chain